MTLLACRARGADRVVNTRREDALAAIDEYTHGRGVDVVFETAGSRVTIGQTPFAARLGGLVVLVGISPEEELPYNFGQVMAKELRISVITTKRAYEELEREGLIVTQTGRGSFVAQVSGARLREEQLRAVEAHLAQAVREAVQAPEAKGEAKV